jgi:hypothetical protein
MPFGLTKALPFSNPSLNLATIQMAFWILLLAAVVFFMYVWNSRGEGLSQKPGCSTCPHKKNVGLD